MKKTTLFIVIGILTFFTGIGGWIINGYAVDPITQVLSDDILENSIEREEVESLFNADFPTAKKMIKDNPSFLPKKYRNKAEEAIPQSMGMPYKVYIAFAEFFKSYQVDGNFKKAFTNEYLWEIPLLDKQGNVVSTITVWKYNGKWDIAQTGLNIPADTVAFCTNNKAIKELLENNDLKSIKQIKHLRLYNAKMDVLYIVSDTDEEYLIPMSHRAKYLGLENLKIYPLNELMDKICENVELPQIDEKGAILAG